MSLKYFFATAAFFALSLLSFAAPLQAQDNPPSGGGGNYPYPSYPYPYPNYSISNLSDVTGPFLGNITLQVPGIGSTTPRAVGVWVPLPNLLTQNFITQTGAAEPGNNKTQQNIYDDLLDSALSFNNNMEKLLPFCGCASPRLRNYNKTVKDAGRLRQALTNAASAQRQTLGASPTPQQVAQAQPMLTALENTTMALERASEVLTALAKELDKAR